MSFHHLSLASSRALRSGSLSYIAWYSACKTDGWAEFLQSYFSFDTDFLLVPLRLLGHVFPDVERRPEPRPQPPPRAPSGSGDDAEFASRDRPLLDVVWIATPVHEGLNHSRACEKITLSVLDAFSCVPLLIITTLLPPLSPIIQGGSFLVDYHLLTKLCE